jgi:hypothetical protein
VGEVKRSNMETDLMEWLNRLAMSNVSDETDDKIMQRFLRRTIYPKAVVTCGMVYTTGYGAAESIHDWSNVLHKYITTGSLQIKK